MQHLVGDLEYFEAASESRALIERPSSSPAAEHPPFRSGTPNHVSLSHSNNLQVPMRWSGLLFTSHRVGQIKRELRKYTDVMSALEPCRAWLALFRLVARSASLEDSFDAGVRESGCDVFKFDIFSV